MIGSQNRPLLLFGTAYLTLLLAMKIGRHEALGRPSIIGHTNWPLRSIGSVNVHWPYKLAARRVRLMRRYDIRLVPRIGPFVVKSAYIFQPRTLCALTSISVSRHPLAGELQVSIKSRSVAIVPVSLCHDNDICHGPC